MPDPYQRVQPRDSIKTAFSARAWNAMLDAARAERAHQFDRETNDPGQFRQGSIVRISNESLIDLPRRGVLGLSAPLFRPGDNLNAFLRDVAFRGVVPSDEHVGRFAILLEPAAAGRIARAFVAGVTQVLINVTDHDHTCAEVDPGSTRHLVSALDGSAQILWREGTGSYYGHETGEQWAIVRFGLNCNVGGYYY